MSQPRRRQRGHPCQQESPLPKCPRGSLRSVMQDPSLPRGQDANRRSNAPERHLCVDVWVLGSGCGSPGANSGFPIQPSRFTGSPFIRTVSAFGDPMDGCMPVPLGKHGQSQNTRLFLPSFLEVYLVVVYSTWSTATTL